MSPTLGEDLVWLKQALKEAELSGPDVPVGCVIVRDNKVVGRGHNQKERTHDPTDHAEIVAIRMAANKLGTWRLDGTVLYTTLEPCPMCAEAIIQARIPRLIFGAYDVQSGACGSAFNLFVSGRIYPLPEVLGGITEEACKALLVNFFRGKEK